MFGEYRRRIRIVQRSDGWYVEKKYHGYWHPEHEFPLSKDGAESAMRHIQQTQNLRTEHEQ